jgi:hypothetical protein
VDASAGCGNVTALVGGAQQVSATRPSPRYVRAAPRISLPATEKLARGLCFLRAKSNFRMAESKISMLLMRVYNKIALSLGDGDAIL